MVTKAVLAALVAFAVAAALTPLAARFARRIGAVDELKERGLARKATPLLGGLASSAARSSPACCSSPTTSAPRASSPPPR